MLSIVAGQAPGNEGVAELFEVAECGDWPVGVQLVPAGEVDLEGYAEAELTDTELLALAAEDAMDAADAGDLLGSLALDELALRRLRRARRRAGSEVLRTQGVAA